MLHDRRELRAGNRIVGPAIVEQEDTTVWLSPGWQTCVDRVGSMHATKIG